MKRLLFTALMASLLCVTFLPAQVEDSGSPASNPDAARDGYTASTTRDVKIPLDELGLLLKPLTMPELQVVADAWLYILQAKVTDLSDATIAVKKQNQQIGIVKGVANVAQKARDVVLEAEKAREQAEVDDPAASEEAREKAAEAEEKSAAVVEALAEGREAVAETMADEGVRQATEEARGETGVQQAAGDTEFDFESSQGLDAALDVAKEAVQERNVVKASLLSEITALRAERTALTDRMKVVLSELDAKGGDSALYQKYLTAVSGVVIDVADTSATWATIMGWMGSEEGGLRWLRNFGKFLLILAAFWLLSISLGKVTDQATRRSGNMSTLLREFIGKGVRRAAMLIGLVMAVAALEININPLLAALGGAAFVIAFALQGTLSNFASGVLILFYKPFDVGDIVAASGIEGHIHSMNLVSTHVRSIDNKLMIVPNNKIWGDVIVNATGSSERRVDLVFGIGYGDDMGKAQKVMEDVVRAHQKVLPEPAPVVQVHELGDSSVNCVCRPWVRPEDYWTVYWDITRGVKEAFDANGISIPFPQRDVHVHNEKKAGL